MEEEEDKRAGGDVASGEVNCDLKKVAGEIEDQSDNLEADAD